MCARCEARAWSYRNSRRTEAHVFRVSVRAPASLTLALAVHNRAACGGTAHLTCRFVQSRYALFRAGAGMRVFALNDPQLGVDLLYGIDVFGQRPAVACRWPFPRTAL